MFAMRREWLCVALAFGSTLSWAGPVGYGAATTGGGSASAVTVSSMSAMQAAIDAYSGTGGLVLNYTGTFDFGTIPDSCTQWKLPAQIVEIKNKGNITIMGTDGSAANFGIHVAGAASNVIIRNMTFGLLPGGGNADTISLEGMSSGQPSNIWIDHNTIFASTYECPGAGDSSFDGGIDMKKGVHNVTVSYNYIHDYQKVGLNGYSDSDSDNAAARTTYHHNRFENVRSRLPLQRFGMTHVYNNYYNNILVSGINVRMGGQSLIESNYFENAMNPVTSRDSSAIGYWDLRNNYVGSNITWDIPASASKYPYVNATNWTTTKPYGSTGYLYVMDAPACVKNVVLATAGAGMGLKESNGTCTGGTSSSSSSAASSASSSVASSSSSSKASSSASSSVASSSSSSAASSSSSSSASGAPVLTGTGDYPTGFSKCADLGGTCSVNSGTGWVAFGRKGSWVTKYVGVGNNIACTVAAFGSEPNGNPDKCSSQN